MSDRVRVGSVDDFAVGKSHEIVAAGRVIALIRSDDEFFALDGICPHAGGPLGKGYVAAGRVTCPWHGWQFELGTGQNCLTPSIQQECFPVAVLNGEVYIDFP